MKSTSKNNSLDLDEVKLNEVINFFKEISEKLGIEFYLIGAKARDMWLLDVKHLDSARATEDIDFAVKIDTYDQYEEIRSMLLRLKFVQTDLPYRLRFSGSIVDLIPFGSIARDDMISLNNGKFQMSVKGMNISVQNSKDLSPHLHLITLPALCVLKLISYSEKKAERGKDFTDFIYILENYFFILGDKIYNDYIDILAEVHNDKLTGAKILGTEIRNIISRDKEIQNIVIGVLQEQLKPFNTEELIQLDFDKEDKDIKTRIMISYLIEEVKSDL